MQLNLYTYPSASHRNEFSFFLVVRFYSFLTHSTICGQSESKRPYGELGSVAKSNCFCCVAVTSSFGDISPGCGCDEDTVDEIVNELKARQRGRGDIAQIQRTEEIKSRLDDMDNKLNLIMNHLNIPESQQMTDRA